MRKTSTFRIACSPSAWPRFRRTAAEPAENPIFPSEAKLELLHTRQATINSGLTEGAGRRARRHHLLHRHAVRQRTTA